MTILKWKTKGDSLESTDGRFYMTKSVNMVRLYDSRNQAAGGVAVDNFEEGKRLAARIAISRPSTNFKRRGRHAPAGATTATNREPKPTNAKRSVSAISVKGSRVEFEQNGVTAMLDCDGELHARLVAQALSDGLVRFDTRCE